MPALPPWLRGTRTRPVRKTRLGVLPLEDRTVPSWLGQLGGAGNLVPARQHAADAAGNVYVCGWFDGTADFDPDPSASTGTASAGSYDGFVAKYTPFDPAGDPLPGGAMRLAWTRRVGGAGFDTAYAVAADPAGGGVYVTGGFQGTADLTGDGVPDATSAGGDDVYVLRLDAGTGATGWARTFGSAGTEDMDGGSLAATDGFVYVGGSFAGAIDFDPGPGVRTLTPLTKRNTTPEDGFVLKLDAAGNHAASWQFGGTDSADRVHGLVADGDTVYVSGMFQGTADFDPGPGTTARTSRGGCDFFLARYTTAAGSPTPALNWVRDFGNADTQTGGHLAGDGDALYLTGQFTGTLDLDPTSAAVPALTSAGGTDVFVARYAKADGGLAWARRYGGAGGDTPSGPAAVDPATGTVYVGGSFSGSVDLDPGAAGGEYATPTGADRDGFLVRLGAADGGYRNSWRAGGPMDDGAIRPVGVGGGSVRAFGTFRGTAALPTGDVRTSEGQADGGLMVLDPAAPAAYPPPVVSVAGGAVAEGGAGGRVALTFTVSLSWASDQPVTVYFRTVDGTAAAGSDYEAQQGSLTFAPGETTKTVTVWVLGDTAVEADETFSLALYAAPDWTNLLGQATGTITNDDTGGGKPRK
ncbi:MAG: Calx-beta domain-containing protein [Gemmataceae bacterium]